MLRFPVLVALLGAASAQTVCKDDANFLWDRPFVTGYGPDGDRTCGDWRLEHFTMPMSSVDVCLGAVSFGLVGFAGEMTFPRYELLMYIAKPGDGRDGAGCCGNSTDGSACDQFEGEVPTPPCPTEMMGAPVIEDKGMCAPCYGRVRDGECQQCSGFSVDGCSQSECLGLPGGRWREDMQQCGMCLPVAPHGCGEGECGEMNGTWEPAGQYCMACMPERGDVSGCTKQQCEESGNRYKMFQDCDYSRPIGDECVERGYCMRCAPEDDDVSGCSEGQCMGAGGNWDEFVQECRMCSPWKGSLHGCNREQCDSAGGMYKAWEHCQGEGEKYHCVEKGYCARCAPEERDVGGCSEEQCSVATNANWDRFEEVCNVCSPEDNNIHGCSREQCDAAGGGYKTWDHCEGVGESYHCVERGYCARCAPEDRELSGCSEEQCDAAPNGNWDQFEGCMECNPEHGNIHGCSREQCDAAGGMYKMSGFAVEGRGYCARCAPEDRDLSGCSEERCNAAEKTNWDQFDQECRACDPDSMDVSGCSREQCEESGNGYKMWEHCDGWGENYSCVVRGYCANCAPDHMDVSGCNEHRCMEAGRNDSSILWQCRDGWDGGQCECRLCSHDMFWGCADRGSCEASARTWCDESHCTDRCGSDCSWEDFGSCLDHGSCEHVGGSWCGTHCAGRCDGRWEEYDVQYSEGSSQWAEGGGQCASLPSWKVSNYQAKGIEPRRCP